MTARDIVVDLLLGICVLLVLASVLGVILMRLPTQKVHFVSLSSVVAPIALGLAVLVQTGWDENSAMTWLALLFVVTSGPFLSHATVRAIRVREVGDWRPGKADAPGGGGEGGA